MSRTLALSVTASAVLDGSGNGIAAAGPQAAGEVWQQFTVAVSCSSNAAEATCKVYAGAPVQTASTFGDGTTWGSTGNSTTNVNGPVHPGQEITAVWTGGDPGATATMVITGTRSVP